MLISLVTIPKILKKAAGSDTYKIIKVLEIEPGDKHRLTDGYTNNGYKLSVTYVDMPSFISTISTITGDYDVVYIGRANNDLPSLWNTDNNYRDYSAPFKQEWGTSLQGSYGCLSGEEVKYKDVTQSVWYGTMGLYEGANFNKLRYASKSGHITSTINGKTKTFSEYYPENDITNKKAKQILNMINSNQLVYIDNSIVTSNSLSTTKLVKNFKDCNKSNFKKVTLLDNNTLINDYTKTDSLSKRPDATLNEVPSGDTNENSNADESEILKNRVNNRSLKFTFTLNNTDSSKHYSAKLYLDYNEDGLFEGDGSGSIKGDECVYTLTDAADGLNTINYNLPSSFVGYLNFKIRLCFNIMLKYSLKNYRWDCPPIILNKRRLRIIL